MLQCPVRLGVRRLPGSNPAADDQDRRGFVQRSPTERGETTPPRGPDVASHQPGLRNSPSTQGWLDDLRPWPSRPPSVGLNSWRRRFQHRRWSTDEESAPLGRLGRCVRRCPDHQRGQHHSQCGASDARPRFGSNIESAAVDRRQLCDGIRRSALCRRKPGRQIRTPTVLSDWPHRVRNRFDRCGGFGLGRCPDRLSGRHGSRCCAHHSGVLVIINDSFRDPTERARAIGVWAGTVGLGIAVGPIAGGLLLLRFWWGSIFLVNVPIVCMGLVGAAILVPESKNPDVHRPDPVGAMLSIVGLGLLLWSIIEGPSQGWLSTPVLGVGFISLVTLAGFVLWETHRIPSDAEHAVLS